MINIYNLFSLSRPSATDILKELRIVPAQFQSLFQNWGLLRSFHAFLSVNHAEQVCVKKII
jgi:hypothetical protein